MVSHQQVYDIDIWKTTQEAFAEEAVKISSLKGFGFFPGIPESYQYLLQVKDISLIQSECSEMLEALRLGDWSNIKSEKIPDFTLLEEEAADVYIRLLEFCSKNGLNLFDAVIAKNEYNSNRPQKHGGKRF